MIYLIGGSPRCGKTTIAKKLSKKLGVSWISADMLESIVSLYIPKRDMPKLFPKAKLKRETGWSNDKLYSKYTSKQITRAYIQQSKVSWKAIEMAVLVSHKEGHDLIIEGHQVHPKLMAKLQRKYHGFIKSVVVTRFDPKIIVSDARKNKARNDWFLQQTHDKSVHYKIADMLVDYSIFFGKEAKSYHIKVFNMDKGFNKQVANIISWLS